MHDMNCFITLTYDEEHVPEDGSLNHRHFQEFLKDLRQKMARKGYPKIRYYMCGEYGDTNGRPHYHAIIFGFDFSPDRYYWRSRGRTRYFRSPLLESCWEHGFCDLSDFSYGAAAYVARYVSKKINGPDAVTHYVNQHGEQIKPEYNRMSLKPGLGDSWFKRYRKEIFPADEVVVIQNGKERKYPVPRYYTDKWGEICPTGVEIIKRLRKKEAEARGHDSPERSLEKERLLRKKLKPRSLNDEI